MSRTKRMVTGRAFNSRCAKGAGCPGSCQSDPLLQPGSRRPRTPNQTTCRATHGARLGFLGVWRERGRNVDEGASSWVATHQMVLTGTRTNPVLLHELTF